MKKIGILMVAIVFIMASCTKDENIVSGVNAKVDGKEWNASKIEASENGDVLVIEATTENNEKIVIRTEGKEEGTYDLSSEGNFCTFTTNTGKFYCGHPNSNKPSGKVTITNYDKKNHLVSGHFEWNVYDENHNLVSCKNGEFGEINVDVSNHPHPKCGIFVSDIDNGYCGSDGIKCVTENDHLKIESSCGSGKKVSFKIPAHCTTGSYEIGPWNGTGSVSCDFNENGGIFGSFNANCGTFVVTKHDETQRTIEGTFHMTLVSFNPFDGGIEFQNGSFTTQY